MFIDKEIVYKVTAYITRFNNGTLQLLVFKEEGFEHLGLQVPGGTVENNEGLLEAVIREVNEESGITNLLNINFLGEYTYTSEKLRSVVKRYYFQMEGTSPDQFTHVVQSNDEDNGWIYNYFWIDINDRPMLYSYLGIHLDKIR